MVEVFLWSQLILPFIVLANILLDANYLFMAEKPIISNPFLIGEWPWYLIILEFASLLNFAIVYLPFGIKYWKERNLGPIK